VKEELAESAPPPSHCVRVKRLPWLTLSALALAVVGSVLLSRGSRVALLAAQSAAAIVSGDLGPVSSIAEKLIGARERYPLSPPSSFATTFFRTCNPLLFLSFPRTHVSLFPTRALSSPRLDAPPPLPPSSATLPSSLTKASSPLLIPPFRSSLLPSPPLPPRTRRRTFGTRCYRGSPLDIRSCLYLRRDHKHPHSSEATSHPALAHSAGAVRRLVRVMLRPHRRRLGVLRRVLLCRGALRRRRCLRGCPSDGGGAAREGEAHTTVATTNPSSTFTFHHGRPEQYALNPDP